MRLNLTSEQIRILRHKLIDVQTEADLIMSADNAEEDPHLAELYNTLLNMLFQSAHLLHVFWKCARREETKEISRHTDRT